MRGAFWESARAVGGGMWVGGERRFACDISATLIWCRIVYQAIAILRYCGRSRGDVMLEMRELSSRPASSAKLACRWAAMHVSKASTTAAVPHLASKANPYSNTSPPTDYATRFFYATKLSMMPAGSSLSSRIATPPRAVRHLNTRPRKTT
jgi:hypothetical protein